MSAFLAQTRTRAHVGGRLVTQTAQSAYRGSTRLLSERVFPVIVSYATHPYVIAGTILLLIPLIVFASVTSLALILGNYTNVVSASVSSIVLLQGMKHHVENKRLHAQHAAQIAELHATVRALQGPASAATSTAPTAPSSTRTTNPTPSPTTRVDLPASASTSSRAARPRRTAKSTTPNHPVTPQQRRSDPLDPPLQDS